MNDETSQLESDLDLGNALARLKNNRDFKRLFLKMYLGDGAIMLTKNLKKIKYNTNAKMDVINDAFIARSDVYGFMVYCDEEINTPTVIDNNTMVTRVQWRNDKYDGVNSIDLTFGN